MTTRDGGTLTDDERAWACRADLRLELRGAPPRMVELRIEQIKADAYAAGRESAEKATEGTP